MSDDYGTSPIDEMEYWNRKFMDLENLYCHVMVTGGFSYQYGPDYFYDMWEGFSPAHFFIVAKYLIYRGIQVSDYPKAEYMASVSALIADIKNECPPLMEREAWWYANLHSI